MAPGNRDVARLNAAPRCGAKTRKGAPCRAPVIHGKSRCRMHGGKGSGAPAGNRNGLKHGLFTREEQRRRRAVLDLMRKARATLREAEQAPPVSRGDEA